MLGLCLPMLTGVFVWIWWGMSPEARIPLAIALRWFFPALGVGALLAFTIAQILRKMEK